MKNYREFLEHLNCLQENAIKPGLLRVREACRIFGSPEREIQSVQIAGTNGKGSTAAFLESIIRNSGYGVGLYTSPHLVDVRERIQINRNMISEDEIVLIAGEVCDNCSDLGLSYFEFLTVISFLYFTRQKVDIAIFETGLGGTWDATSVLEPLLTLMSPISIDHTNFLGTDIKLIAREKCGIIKQGVTLISAPQSPVVHELVTEECSRLNAPLVFTDGIEMTFCHCDPKGRSNPVDKEIKWNLSLYGEHQIVNASLAVAAADFMKKAGFELKDYQEALENTAWPGRLQIISDEPEILLDGAHNPAGACVLAKYLKDNYKNRDIVIIFGAMRDKDISGIMGCLKPVVAKWLIYEMDNERAASPDIIISAIGAVAEVVHNPREAVSAALNSGLKNPLIVVTGSLYLVGEFLREFYKGACHSENFTLSTCL